MRLLKQQVWRCHLTLGPQSMAPLPPPAVGRTDENIKTHKALRHCVKRQHYKNLNAAGKPDFVTFKPLQTT